MAPTATKKEEVVALTTRVREVSTDNLPAVIDVLVGLNMAGAKHQGFWSGELVAPLQTDQSWKLIQRFSVIEDAEQWRSSSARANALENLTALNTIVSEEIQTGASVGDAATLIVTQVRPDQEERYFQWEAKIQSAQAQSAGYRGAYLQPPVPGRADSWSTMVHYESPSALEGWFASEIRHKLVAEAEQLVKGTTFKKVDSSFPGWFPSNAEGESPPNWKTALLVLLGLYPVVVLEMRFLTPFETTISLALAAFINLVISVILTTWGTMPVFIKAFSWWLYPKHGDLLSNQKGMVLIAAIFCLEIALSWNLITR